MLKILRCELYKTFTLRSVWIGIAVGIFGNAAICMMNSLTIRSAINDGDTSMLADTSPLGAAFSGLPIATVGAVVIAVMAVGSEYTASTVQGDESRQLTTTLAAIPSRVSLIIGKTFAISFAVLFMAIFTVPLSTVVAEAIIGDIGIETITPSAALKTWFGTTIYWTLTALMAEALILLTREVLIALTFLVANNSLISFSYLLTKLTSLANYLPDMAGRSLFGMAELEPGQLEPLPGGIVMTIWTIALLALGTTAFVRRDA